MTINRIARLGDPLTAHELRVLSRIADGMTYVQAGRALSLSHETIRSHLSRCRTKLGARNGTHAVAMAFRTGLLKVGAES